MAPRALKRSLMALKPPEKLAKEGVGGLIVKEVYRAIRDLCRALGAIGWP